LRERSLFYNPKKYMSKAGQDFKAFSTGYWHSKIEQKPEPVLV